MEIKNINPTKSNILVQYKEKFIRFSTDWALMGFVLYFSSQLMQLARTLSRGLCLQYQLFNYLMVGFSEEEEMAAVRTNEQELKFDDFIMRYVTQSVLISFESMSI